MKQKKRLGRKVISHVLALVMVFSTMTGIVPGMSLTAYAAGVSYVDGSGTTQTVDATELATSTTSWTNGLWYIVPEGGLTISGRIAVNGTVNLILRDGATLTASAGITVTVGNTLNIYAQSAGTGALSATGANGVNAKNGGNAGIGSLGSGYQASAANCGTINIYGGTITATGGNGEKIQALAQVSAVAVLAMNLLAAAVAAQSAYTAVLLRRPAVMVRQLTAQVYKAAAQVSAAAVVSRE